MKKDMFYRVVIILLLLLNLCTLSFLWVSSRQGSNERGHRPPPPHRIIINRLHLDEQQQGQFLTFRNEHHRQMVAIQSESSQLHKDLFALLQQADIDTLKRDDLLGRIQVLNLRREHVTFYHFTQLRSILKPGQTKAFDDLVADLSQRVMGPHPQGRP